MCLYRSEGMTPFDTNITGESGKGKENRKKKCKKKGDLMEKRKKTKWFAAVGSLFLMVLMLSTSVFAAESSGLVYGSGTITRAEWLHDLVTVFDMTVEDDNLPDHYYQDLTSDKEYYRDMMAAVEFGIIDIPSGESIYPEQAVTRQFAASTLNYCLGLKYEGEKPAQSFKDYSSLSEDFREDAQIAVDRGWFALSNGAFAPESSVTSAEVGTMLNDAKTIWNSTQIDEQHENSFSFADGVIVVPETSSVEVEENTVSIYDPDVKIKKDDLFAVYVNGLPQVYKAVSVKSTADGLVITTEEPENEDTLQKVDAEGIQEADLATAVPAEGMDVTYFTDGTAENSYTDGVPYRDSRLAGSKKINAVTFGGKIALGKGVNVNVTCTLSNTMLSYKVKTANHEAYASIKGDVAITGTVSGDLNEISGIPKTISLGGMPVGGVGYIGIYARVTASGKVTVTYEAVYEAGIQHSDRTGTRYIRSFQKKNFGSEADLQMSLGFGLEAKFMIPCVTGRVAAEAGLKASYKDKVYNDGKSPNWCATFQSWMYAQMDASLTIDYGIGKKVFGKTIVVYDLTNSPVRYIAHWEDSLRVPRCTRDTSDSWFINGFQGIYGSIGDGYGFNEAGEYVPVYTYTTYKNDSNQTVARITGYTGRTYALVIPDTIDDYTVESIGSGAFAKRSDITAVVIPDTVKKIESNAFGNCQNIRSVQLSSNLKQIDAHAFYNCDKLTGIQIPKSLETTATAYIPSYAYGYVWGPFYGCDNLKHVTFEEGTKKVAKGLFANCPGLEEVTIPDSVVQVEESAFYQCDNLKQVNIGSAVTTLGYTSFAKCDIQTLEIPDHVLTISGGCFAENENLSGVKLSENLETLDAHAFYNCDSLTSIEIPKTLKTVNTVYINQYAYGYVFGPFYGCDGLKQVTFEDGLNRIPQGLFANCPGLEEISMPDSVQKIGNNAFASCVSIKEVTIGKGVTLLETKAFAECEALEKIEIPDNVLTIDAGCFANCTLLSDVTLSKNLTTLNALAFYNCDQLESIEIPKSLETTNKAYLSEYVNNYYNGPFYGCDGLKTVTFEAGRPKIPQGLFASCPGLEEITIPDTVTEIENAAFEFSKNLSNIVIPKKLKAIRQYAFNQCKALTELDLSDTEITEMDNHCFKGCTGLQKIKLPKNGKVISEGMFSDCSSLESVELPEGIEQIDTNAFYNSGLKSIVIPSGVTVIGIKAFQQSKLESITIKDAAVSIKNRAFDSCTSLNRADLGKRVTDIDQEAFKNCDRLESITIPDSVTSINTGIFESCDSLKEIKISTGIKEIPQKMCYECSNLESVVLPYAVTKVKAQAFANCPKLTKITIPKNTATIADDVFSYPTKMTVYGVKGSYAETYAGQKSMKFEENTTAAANVELGDTELTLRNGQSKKLALSVTPENFADDVAWRSSNAQVVSVDANGTVKALSVGTATVQVNVGNVSARCKITVVQPVERIYLNKGNANLEALETLQLTADVRPSTAGNREITWTSSMPEVASVSETGLVSALKKGKATITATAKDGSGVTATCQITVTNSVYVVTDPTQMESSHPYENKCKDIWMYTSPSDAKKLLVTFDERTSIEEDFDDVLYIYGENNRLIGQYKGIKLAGKTITVPGKTVKIKLDTDAAGTDWGFKVTSIKEDAGNGTETGGDGEKEDQNLKNGTVSVKEACIYDGSAKTPELTVSYEGTVLTRNVDYTVSYYNNINAGAATAVITGIGQYTGSLTYTFSIGKAQADLAFANGNTEHYVGEQFTNPLTVRMAGGKIVYRSSDDSIASTDPNTGLVTVKRAGRVQITAAAEEGDNVYGGEASFVLNAVSVQNRIQANQIQASDVMRTASKKVQSFKIYASANGAALTFRSNNKNVQVNDSGQVTVAKNYTGKAVIVIRSAAFGRYAAAEKTIVVTINPTGTSLGSCKNVKGRKAQIRWKKNKQVSGYEIQYSTSKNFRGGVKKKMIKKAGTTKVTLTKLKKKQKYYIRIRTYRKNGGEKTYSSWSRAKMVKIKK